MTFRALSRMFQTGLLLLVPVLLAANEIQTAVLDAPAADGARLKLQLATAPRQKVFAHR